LPDNIPCEGTTTGLTKDNFWYTGGEGESLTISGIIYVFGDIRITKVHWLDAEWVPPESVNGGVYQYTITHSGPITASFSICYEYMTSSDTGSRLTPRQKITTVSGLVLRNMCDYFWSGFNGCCQIHKKTIGLSPFLPFSYF